MTQAPSTLPGPTEKDKLVALRTFSNNSEREAMRARMETGWPHIRPNSVLVAAIGNHWKPGSWQRVVDMITHTNEQGTYCALSEIQDRCFNPYDALGTMRNEAILTAQGEGFDWLLYVDTDVHPGKDALLRLLSWQMPIVAPYVVEPGTGRPLHGPHLQPNTGLHPAKWSVLSMLLFSTRVFTCFPGGTFWSDAIGADEGFHFQRLWSFGHRLWIDSNVQLVVGGRPTYPLATNRMTWDERQQFWREKLDGLNRPPDRRPADANVDPRLLHDGEYLPWMAQAGQQATASAPSVAQTGTAAVAPLLTQDPRPALPARLGTRPAEG